jgi:hypothetical protein
MQKYNVVNVGGEVLNLDGALEHADAIALANEIEAEHNIDVRVAVDGALDHSVSNRLFEEVLVLFTQPDTNE